MDADIARWRADQAERWLRYVRSLGSRISTLQCEIDAQRALAESARSIWPDDLPKTAPNHDQLPNAVVALIELIADYCVELQGYVEEQHQTHEALSGIEDEAIRVALTSYYLLGKSWELCCTEMNYTWDGMMKLRRRALLAAYEVMPRAWRDPVSRAIKAHSSA